MSKYIVRYIYIYIKAVSRRGYVTPFRKASYLCEYSGVSIQFLTHHGPATWSKVDYKNPRACPLYVVTCHRYKIFYYLLPPFAPKTTHTLSAKMASNRMFLLAMIFIALSLISGKVQGSRKLMTVPTTLPDVGNNNIPRVTLPPFPPVTQWPEYRLPPPIFKFPNIPPVPSFFSPPHTATTKP